MPRDLLGDDSRNGPIDIAGFLDSDIPKQIAALVEMGVLVSIGSTRDGGAISLAIIHDGASSREYFRQSDEGLDWLRRATDTLRARGVGRDRDPSRSQQGAVRGSPRLL